MKFTQLKEDIAQGARPIYLAEGDDAYFRAKTEEQIKTAFLSMPELNFTGLDGATLKGTAISDALSALSAFPFMSEKRIVKISEFYPTESEYENYLKEFFENFPETAILLIVNSQSKKGVDLKRKKCVTYIDCNRADRDTVARWAYITLKRADISASVEACEAIADYCLCDMARVSRETQKLIEWGKDAGKITFADVDALVYKDADYRIYQMTGAVARRDFSTFSTILSDLIQKGYDVNSVISSLLNYFKTLLFVETCNLSDAEIAGELKITEFIAGKNRQQARAVGREKLTQYIEKLYSLAASLKSGLITVDGALDGVIAEIFFV